MTDPKPDGRKESVEIFTDGACSGNPGPGGWCAILRARGRERVLSGGEKRTTNNRMELMAALEGLRALKRPCRVRLVSDSKYLVQGMTEWIFGWQRRGWRRAGDKPVRNEDLWKNLIAASAEHDVAWTWVRGHAGHKENERCDKIAVKEIDKIRKRKGGGK